MPFSGNPRGPFPAGLALVFIGLIAVISIAGWIFYQSQEQQVTNQITGDLTVIANLKSDQIVEWRRDRLSDADVLSTGGFFADGADHFLTYGDAESREKILERFRELNRSVNYRNVMLVDPQGTVRLSLDPDAVSPQPVRDQVARSLATGRSGLTDLYRSSVQGSPRMDVIAPLIVRNDSPGRPVGAVVLTIDPGQYLYPYIQRWPVPSASAETLLVERQGDHVLWLNDIRFQNDTALALTMPLNQTDVPSVMAVLGKTGVFTGNDYRNVPVVSVLEPIPGSPWFLVTKVDAAEAYGPWRIQSGLIIILIFTTLAGATVIAGFLWQRRQKYYFRTLYAAESALREEEEKSRLALQAAGQRLRRFYDSGLFGVIFWNMDGKITDANDTFLSMTGYSRSDLEAGSIDWGDLTPPEFRDRDEEAVRELRAAGRNVPYEKEYLRKDGSRLPILIAGAMLDEGRFNGVAFVLDTSELRTARSELATEQRRYRELFDNMPVGMSRSTPGPDARILAANPADLRLFGAASPDELLAAPPGSLYANPEDRLRFIDELTRNGTVNGMEIRFRTLKGTEFWGRISSKRYVAEDGSVFFDNVVEDISLQKEAIENLRLSEERFRGAFDRSTAGKSLTSAPDGKLLQINQAFADMLGYSVEELREINWTDITYPADIPESQECIRCLIAGEKTSYRMEKRYIHKTGRIVWGDVSTSLLRDSDGRPLYLITTILDITERKRAEDALVESRAKLEAALESMTDAVFISDLLGNFIEFNEAFATFHKFRNKAECKKTLAEYPDFLDVYFPDGTLAPLDMWAVPRALRGEVVTNAEYGLRRRDTGESWTGSYSFAPIRDRDGKITGSVVVGRDITEWKKTQEEIRQSEQRYRNIFENMQEGLAYCRMIYDPDGTPADFVYLSVNKSFDRIIGAGTVTGKPVTEIFPGIREAFPRLFEIYGRVSRTGIPELFDLDFFPAGKWLHISVYSPAREYFVAVFSDITERKRAEDALADSEERLRLAQEAANAGTWEWNLATNENYWSEKTFDLYGLDPRTTKASYDTWLASILPPDRETAARAVGDAAAGDLPVLVEWRVNLPENEMRWLMSRGQPVHDRAGKPVKYRGIVMDITDRKKAEARLEESARQRQLALDAARLGWWHYDPVTRIARYDERYREIFGVSGTEKPNDEILQTRIYPEDLKALWQKVEAALDPADPKPYEAVYRINLPGGAIRWIEAHGNAAFEGEGDARHAVSLVGTVDDITDRKKAAESLRETSEYLQNLIAYANAPIIVWDPQFRITRFNRAFEHLTGRTEKEVLGKNLEILFSETGRESSLDLIRKTLAGERWETVEIPIRHADGSVRIVLWNSANVLRPDGSLVSTIAQGQDITGRKHAEEIATLSNRIYQIAHTTGSLNEMLDSLVAEFRAYSGCEAVGIRLLDADGNIPYQAQCGFPRDFYEKETPLSIRTDECMCIYVIRGLVNPNLPVATPGGSFYCNGTTRFLATIPEEEKGRTRNVCNQMGYESVALVPLRTQKGIVGLIQFNDRRENMVPLRMVQTVEGVAMPLGETIRTKQVEDALRESGDKFRLLAESASDWVYWIDTGSRIVYTSPSCREITGYSPEDFYRDPKLLDTIVHPDDRALYTDHTGRFAHAPETGLLDFRIVHREGGVRWISHICKPIIDAGGATAGRRISNREITGRKKAEETLRETSEYLQNLINYANAPIIVWDPQFRITRFNRAFEHLTGMTEQEVLGKNLEILFPEESKAASLGLIRKTESGERWEVVEIPILHTSGIKRTVLWNSASIAGPDGSIVSTIAQGQDITDRKLTEQQREALIRELEQKNAELERFTYTISYDLKSPLITIKGFAGLLENDTRSEDPGQLLNDVRRITTAADTMEQLLSDVLELSRIGRIVAPPERVSFGRIVQEAVDLLAGSIAERRVTVEIAPDLPEVNVDRVRIREVMTNLIENAVKYMGKQPDPRIRIGVSYDEGHPVFFVQDNGIGIERRYLDRIFNLFEKLDPKTPGTGVGLTIVKRIVEVHGGRIWAESEGPGTGTTFRFTLEGRGTEGNRA